jgi:hypothetical protein
MINGLQPGLSCGSLAYEPRHSRYAHRVSVVHQVATAHAPCFARMHIATAPPASAARPLARRDLLRHAAGKARGKEHVGADWCGHSGTAGQAGDAGAAFGLRIRSGAESLDAAWWLVPPVLACCLLQHDAVPQRKGAARDGACLGSVGLVAKQRRGRAGALGRVVQPACRCAAPACQPHSALSPPAPNHSQVHRSDAVEHSVHEGIECHFCSHPKLPQYPSHRR